MKKRWIMLTGLLAVLLTTVAVHGADPLAVHLENAFAENGKLRVYLNTNRSEPLASGEIGVSLGGQAVQLEAMEPFSAADQGTTWLFLADVSGSIAPEKLADIQKILYAMQEKMGPKDNAAVVTVGNDTYIEPFTSDAEALSAQIGGIAGVHENTNLYAGIVKSLELLDTGADVQKKRCMVILSDGEDYHAAGYTREEVDRKIKELHIPVHSVAMLEASSTPSVIAQSKILGSFARESAGGLDLTFGLDGRAPEAFAQQIKSKADSGYLLTLSLSKPPAAERQALLLTLSVQGVGSTTDSCEVLTDGLTAAVTSESEPAASSAVEPAVTGSAPEPAADAPTGLNLWIFVGAGAAALVILLAAVVVIRKKKARKEEEPPLPPPAEAEEAKEPEPVPLTQAPVKQTTAPVYGTVFHLVKVGASEKESFTRKLSDELVIGRGGAAALSFPGDELLSARHCRIFRSGAGFAVEDLGSTNGTYLNGVPVRQPRTIEKDDVLLLGSMELRITWDS